MYTRNNNNNYNRSKNYNNSSCNNCNYNNRSNNNSTYNRGNYSESNCDENNCNNYNSENYNMGNYSRENYNNEGYDDQNHVHEIIGSTAIVRECEECHNHRFCTMSGEAIRMGNSHVHEVKYHTDFVDGHYHEYCGKTSQACNVGNGRHVHYLSDNTESENGHTHDFQVATLIDRPIDYKDCKQYWKGARLPSFFYCSTCIRKCLKFVSDLRYIADKICYNNQTKVFLGKCFLQLEHIWGVLFFREAVQGEFGQFLWEQLMVIIRTVNDYE